MDRDELTQIVSELCSLDGPSGGEDAVGEWLRKRWEPHVAEIRCSPGGNVVARVGGSGRRVLIVAHMDEITYFVTRLREDGFVEADRVRWPPDDRRRAEIPLGHPAVVRGRDEQRIEGTFVAATGHVDTKPDTKPLWWLDFGCSSAAELSELGIHLGAPVVSAAPIRRLGNRMIGKAMDDRALLAAMTVLIERLTGRPRCELWIAATVQEEVGTIGGAAVASAIKPEVALVLDIAPSGRLPGQPPDSFPVDLGGGPVIVHKDISMAYHRGLAKELRTAARSVGRHLQDGAFRPYLTDGREMARAGAMTAVLALPCRYTHSSFETIDLQDVEDLIEILAAWI